MELESLLHHEKGMDGLDGSLLEDVLTCSHSCGAMFSLEKMKEIHCSSNHKIPSSVDRSQFSLQPSKDLFTHPTVTSKEIKEMDINLLLESNFKKSESVTGDINEHQDCFFRPNEVKIILGGLKWNEPDAFNRIKANYDNNAGGVDPVDTSDASGKKRKIPEIDSAHLKSKAQNKESKRVKICERNEGKCRCDNEHEEAGSSKMPPWQVDVIEDMTTDLDGSLSNLGADLTTVPYNMSDALLSLPSLTVFKQEAPSPSQENLSNVGHSNMQQNSDDAHEHSSTLHRLLQQNTFHGSLKRINSAGRNKVPEAPSEKKNEDYRFQYVLAAATSIATKVTEETLTYLNQGQSYEIKLKKVGELSNFRGKILKSIIRISFHERRLQYMEKEQILAWQVSRPGERIVELDIPLSYGLFDVEQDSTMLNMLSFLWDPTKEVGAYIKVNCISTEFTPKKHGGEKGVPFRIQVETFIDGETTRLHAAACQIKVFKLKGADRKHKQDREKILKRPLSEQDKYQPSYECTVLSDLLPEAVFPSPISISSPTSTVNSRPNSTYSPTDLGDSNSNAVSHGHLRSPVNSPGKNDGNIVETSNEKCRSLNSVPPDMSGNAHIAQLSPETNCQQTSRWLRMNSFSSYVPTFANFNGADILRLTRDDLIQICGLADGIRLFYALHSKAIVRLTLYICTPSSSIYHAVYLDHIGRNEISRKLASLLGIHQGQIHNIFLQGPNEIRVLVTDEVVSNIKDESMFFLEIQKDENRGRFVLLLKPTVTST